MKFIVNNKIYDTDKSELLCTFRIQWERKTIWGSFYPMRDTKLYKTAKGAYFLVCKVDCEFKHIEVIGEETAKRYLMQYNYEKYVEMFGALEEA